MKNKKSIRKNGAARKILAALLTLTLVVGLLPGFTLTAFAADGGTIDLAVVPGGNLSYDDWTFDNTTNAYTILDGADVTVTGTSAGDRRIEVAVNATATITLSGVNITGLGAGSPLLLNSGANLTLNLADGTTNTLMGASGRAGIQAPSGTTLTIEGNTGILNATGGASSAGIGGGIAGDGGNITINGGTITAANNNTDYNSGAGIGGGGGGYGTGGAGGNITINGGTITARAYERAAAIGGGGADSSGTGGASGNITINGGTIEAWPATVGGAAIGAGAGGASGNITINGGSVDRKNINILSPTNSAGDNVYLNKLYKTNFLEGAAITDIYGVSYGIKDVVADGSSYLYFYLPSTTASELIAISKDGTNFYGANYQRANNNTNNQVLDLSLTRESTPNAVIDYVDEKLTGLVAGEKYTIDGTEKTADPNGNIAIDSAWFGNTFPIVKIASDGTYLDSAAQSMSIPARPSAPSGLSGVNETAPGLNDGKITGTDVTMEYAKSTAPTNWTDCSASETTGLAPGTYYVRYKAVTSSTPDFASKNASVKITDGSAPVPPKNIKHKITFKANKGKLIKGAKAKKNVTENKKYGKLPTAKRAHYTFEGWYTKKSGGKKISATTKVTVKKNQTLYAHWQKQHKFAKLNKGVSALHIRTQPNVKAKVIGYLTPGKNIQLISKVDRKGKSKDWYKVKYKGKTAYIHAPFVHTYWK